MPCFLAGVCEAKPLASALGAEYMEFSHQQGHLAAAAWSAGREDLLDQPFLAWHLSGGTTELLLVQPKNGGALCGKNRRHHGYFCRAAAGSYWRFAGPAVSWGKYVDELYYRADSTSSFRVKVNELYFFAFRVENKVKSLREMGETEANIARFAVDTVVGAVYRVTNAAKKCILDCRCSVPVVWRRILCSALYCRMRCLHYRSIRGTMRWALPFWRAAFGESREAQR